MKAVDILSRKISAWSHKIQRILSVSSQAPETLPVLDYIPYIWLPWRYFSSVCEEQ